MQLSRHWERGFRAGIGGLLLGLTALTLSVSFAQDGPPAPLPAGSFRVSVVPEVTAACGTAASGAGLQQSAETRLRGVGMTVSDVHNSQLAVDVDCVPVMGSRKGLAVHQCLGFSEVVSAAAGDRQMLASTWHKCESYVCQSSYCPGLVNSGQAALLDAFLANMAERKAQVPAQPPVTAAVYESAATAVYGRVIFFGLYMIACVTTGVYWQLRKRAEARVG